MNTQQIREIIGCLPRGRTRFYYFRDRYALDLLARFVGSGMPIREVRTSSFARLLDKPIVKTVMAGAGDGILRDQALQAVWPQTPLAYLLTLSHWGNRNGRERRWNQTTCLGKNLVLQLNFNSHHNAAYSRLINPQVGYHPFHLGAHPARAGKRMTLAWARLDIDLDAGEALIEEIQNDWLRWADYGKTWLLDCGDELRERFMEIFFEGAKDVKAVLDYINATLKPHKKTWDEAMLAATIWFLREELGITRIYYHTYETGIRMKGMGDWRPPRSIYTKLPERFCFRLTETAPTFVQRQWPRRLREEAARGKCHWFLLEG